MIIKLHQTHHLIADFDNYLKKIKDVVLNSEDESLHIFPELFLTGYPLQDLCLQRSFIDNYMDFLNELNEWLLSINKKDIILLVGGLKYSFKDDLDDIPHSIENVIYRITPGEKIIDVYSKMLLPNYDIFDEKKYFLKGDKPSIVDCFGKKVGLLICEDMWHSSVHEIDPVKDLANLDSEIDLVVNLSASPYNLYKIEKRKERGIEISNILNAPFVYCNRVGSEDEIIFDGNSFVVNGNELLNELSSFSADSYSFALPKYTSNQELNNVESVNTWESLFSPDIVFTDNKLPTLKILDDKHCQEIIDALCFGVQEYITKAFFNKIVIALSGGLDSALVLAILKISLKEGQTLEAIYMPSEYSRDISFEVSKAMCESAQIPFHVLDICKMHDLTREMFKDEYSESLEGIADENIQSRIRGALLYARSNQKNAIVINTSNKSELAVGYSTIYGDSIGAISLLGDLYKSEIYQLSRYVNKKYNSLIPVEIIEREPSAELRDNQVDTDSLPPYERLDTILEGILSYRLSANQLVTMGFDKKEVERVLNLYRKTEFKRSQFCPILKIKSKSFGFGYRVPLSKNSNYYMKFD